MNKVLIVDDDLDFLETIKKILNDASFEVETISTQEDIYNYILSFNPQVILLDIYLNGADGRNICKGLKNHFRTRKIPIILCSGDSKEKDKYPEYMAEDFIEKPLNVENLIQRLNNYCK